MKCNRTKKLGIAMLGCGKMGMQHVRAIQSMGSANILAAADLLYDQKKLKTFLPERTQVFREAEELFWHVKPDVVHITTPPDTHADLAKLALQNEASIYVEKPFTLSVTEAEDIVKLASKKGLKICPGHQVLFEKAAVEFQNNLPLIGKIVHVESYFSFRQVRRSITPADQLIDILPHPVYLLLHILNEASEDKLNCNIEVKSIEVTASGDVFGVLGNGEINGNLNVTLRGRPVESYLRIVGTTGNLYADFVRGTVTKLIGPGESAFSAILNPYIIVKQILVGTTKAFISRSFRKQKSYPGLFELIEAFYQSILNNRPSPFTTSSIIDTVRVCQVIGTKLKEAEAMAEQIAEDNLQQRVSVLAPPDPNKGMAMVTGGTGFLGKKVVSDLVTNGWPVRVVARHTPLHRDRVPGADYKVADLGDGIPQEILEGVETVIHCAAETSGGKDEHKRNTVLATRNILSRGALAGIKKFIIISSLAVLKPGREVGGSLDEKSPVDVDNLGRGPYVWGKAESEHLSQQLAKELDVSIKIIRPGPLVDFDDFEAPGRLGREIGPLFVAIGGRRSGLSVCDIQTAAEVIRYYVESFDASPQVINLVEPTTPTRAQLVTRLIKKRSDLRVFWIPMIILRILSPVMKFVQRIVFSNKKPVDIQVAFASEGYKTDLVSQVIQSARKLNP